LSKQLVIEFGALSGQLKNQLASQGVKLTPACLRSMQQRMYEIIGLRCLGFATQAEAKKIEGRIMKVICGQARPISEKVRKN